MILNKQNNVMQETLSKQTLKDYLAYFIFTVTAYHRHVGTVGDFTLDPTLSTGKIRPGATSGTVQGTIQIMSIAMATASPQVLLMKYSPEHLLLEDEHKATLMKGWRQMISNLEALEVKIHERNLKRRFRCTTFLPSVQGISIGVYAREEKCYNLIWCDGHQIYCVLSPVGSLTSREVRRTICIVLVLPTRERSLTVTCRVR